MNKVLIIKVSLSLLMFSVLVACGGGGSPETPEAKRSAEMHKLARMNGCIECHRLNATVVGPSWIDVAKRYKDSPTEEIRAVMIERVNKGTQGLWLTWKGGDGMPPMENRVKPETIEQLVDYILSLRSSLKDDK